MKRLLPVVALGLALSCSNRPPEIPSDGFDRKGLVASLGEKVVLPSITAARQAADQLKVATAAYRAAGGGAGAEREAAQAAWRTMMLAWQRVEMMQVGPAASSMATLGKNLRDDIYSWPTMNACRVDQEVVRNRFREPNFFAGALVTVYGLDALEYLLFHDGTQNDCPATSDINAQGTWAALSSQELERRRADYADALAAKVAADCARVVEEWEGADGFLSQLKRAGETGSAFNTAQMAADEIFTAMMFLDLKVKDRKLAEPAGLSAACTTDICPEKAESRYARHSKQNLVANLRAFQALFLGNNPGEEERPGFDDFLVARGAAELSEKMTADVQAAIEAAEAISPSLEEALSSDLTRVTQAHAAVKKVTDSLKSQFVSVLSLRVPDEGASDND